MTKNKDFILRVMQIPDQDTLRGLIVHYAEWIIDQGKSGDALVGWIYILVDQLNLDQLKVVVESMLNERERQGLADDVDQWRAKWKAIRNKIPEVKEETNGEPK